MVGGVGVNLAEKRALFSDLWALRVIETVDELFLVLDGRPRMDFRDRQTELGEGEMIVVPAGVEHKPFAAAECRILLLERRGTANAGDAPQRERARVAENP